MSQALQADSLDAQSKLAAYCRSGKEQNLPGITPNRLHHYRRLVFNVVKDALRSTYPLTHNMLTGKQWENLCHEFFEQHPCQDPQVWKMPYELIAYLDSRDHELKQEYPHLVTLLLFEWKELEYYMMPDREQPAFMSADMWKDPWALNAEAEVMTLDYPVHLKNARFISRTDCGHYFCLIFRQPVTGKIMFMDLSPFFAWMLATMMVEPISMEDIFPVMQSEFGIPSKDFIIQHTTPFHQKLAMDGFLL